MPWPSTLGTFTDPLAGDNLNSPSHSSIETAQNTALEELQVFLGTQSSAVGTIFYDVRATASGGGGHIQTAILGGTGQTTFAKGDVLAAANSSTLSKLVVGSDNQYLIADATQATGVKWGTPVRVGSSASVQSVVVTTTETSIVSVTIPASVLSSTNVIRGTAFVSAYTAGQGDNLLIKANYGANQVASILLVPSSTVTASVGGKIEYTLLANAASDTQRGELFIDWKANRLNFLANSVLGVDGYNRGTSSINSNLNQTFGLTAQWTASITGSRLDVDGYIVEKIL